jgi:hypothetical protein
MMHGQKTIKFCVKCVVCKVQVQVKQTLYRSEQALRALGGRAQNF